MRLPAAGGSVFKALGAGGNWAPNSFCPVGPAANKLLIR
jgi:hypothetical protein